MSLADHPTPTGHAADRWNERTDADVDLETAWGESQRIRAAERHCGDEVRYHHGQDVALVRQGCIIATVRPRGEGPLWRTIDDHLGRQA